MHRNGSFVNLIWEQENLKSHHGAKWDEIRKDHGLLAGTAATEGLSLYDLASNCVFQCRDLLFSLITPIFLNCDIPKGTNILDFSFYTRHLMMRSLQDYLCTHLLVSFAYRFFCENLEPKSFREYCNILYSYENGTPSDTGTRGANLDDSRNKSDHYKNLRRKYCSFCDELRITSGSSEESTLFDELESIAVDKASVRNLQKLLSLELDIDNEKHAAVPPPCAWFLLFFVSERIRYLDALNPGNPDHFFSLSRIISNSPYSKYLFEQKSFHNIDRKVPAELLCLDRPVLFWENEVPFVGISTTTVNKPVFHMPDTAYKLKGTDESVEISSRLQLVFNNYLLERNFHLLAMSTAEDYLKSFCTPSTYDPRRTKTTSLPTMLHAPLVHSGFISFIAAQREVHAMPSVIESYIDRWNRYALPALEELFIQTVWVNYKNPVTLADAINKWIASDTVYNQLNMIRLIPAKTITETPYSKESQVQKLVRTLHDDIFYHAFSIS